jgi:AAHS family benzoate transporter-like MFS transporter
MSPRARRAAILVTALCWTIVVFDGYDLIVYGTVLPQLLQERSWHLTPSVAGLLGSLAFLGMLIGALLAGHFADLLGRRRTILACTTWFSLFTALCAVASNPQMFGAFRLLAGLGLGGLVPSANALTAEFVRSRHRSVVATLMMSGVPIGGSLAAVVGLVVLPRYGWRAMFVIALLAVVVILPFSLRFLPESPAWLRSKGRLAEATALEARFDLASAPGPAAQEIDALEGAATPPARAGGGMASLLRAPYTRPTILFAAATLATLFAWYGLGTWLPQLMRSSGYNLGSALGFLLALNLGAVAGSVITAGAGVRFGPIPTAVGAALVAAGGLVSLLPHPGTAAIYVALVLAGVGTHGVQCLIIAAVATHYPPKLRGSSLGFALGVGRIGAVAAPQVGGWLLAAGLGVDSNFLAFAAAAALAGILLMFAPRAPRGVEAGRPTRAHITEGAISS